MPGVHQQLFASALVSRCVVALLAFKHSAKSRLINVVLSARPNHHPLIVPNLTVVSTRTTEVLERDPIQRGNVRGHAAFRVTPPECCDAARAFAAKAKRWHATWNGATIAFGMGWQVYKRVVEPTLRIDRLRKGLDGQFVQARNAAFSASADDDHFSVCRRSGGLHCNATFSPAD